MKKVLASKVMLVYLTVSTGFVVSLDYCMDRFNSAQLGHSESLKCDKCGMHKSEGCCHDDVKMVKLSLSHVAGQALAFSLSAPSLLLEQPFDFSPPADELKAANELSHSGAPPGQPPAYLRYRVFRL